MLDPEVRRPPTLDLGSPWEDEGNDTNHWVSAIAAATTATYLGSYIANALYYPDLRRGRPSNHKLLSADGSHTSKFKFTNLTQMTYT